VVKRIRIRAVGDCPRLDHFLTGELASLSRSQVEKLIRDGHVHIDGQPVHRKNTTVRNASLVEVEIVTETPAPYIPSRPLVRLFEDEWLLAIDKPAGMAVHPGAGASAETILDLFRHTYPVIGEMNEKERPGIVHRLDKDTSGVLLLAKDEETMQLLQRQFHDHLVEKSYLAVIAGAMRFRNGTIDQPLTRSRTNPQRFTVSRDPEDHGREAITDYHVLLILNDCTLLQVRPRTGRTHQIRVHLAAQAIRAGRYLVWQAPGSSLPRPGAALPATALHPPP